MKRRRLIALAALCAVLPAGARASSAKKPAGGGGSYLQIKTLTAYTTKPGGRRGVMTVDCGLDIPDPGLRRRADLLLPRIRAAFVQKVQVYAGGLPSGAPPNPDFLADNLQRAADQILGRKGARVLIGAVVVN